MPKRPKSKWRSMPNLAMGAAPFKLTSAYDEKDGINEHGKKSTNRRPREHSTLYSRNVKTKRSVTGDEGDDDDDDLGDYVSASDAESTDEEPDQAYNTQGDGTAEEDEIPTEVLENPEGSKFEESQNLYKKIDSDKYVILEHDILKNGIPLSDHVKSRIIRQRDKRKYYDTFLLEHEMLRRLQEEPQKYKRCIIKIEGAHNAVCQNINKQDEISFVEISGRSKCGRIFNGDEVLVELLNLDKIKVKKILRLRVDINRHNRADRIYGKVVGCFKTTRPMDNPFLGQDVTYTPSDEEVNNPVFVCTLDESCNYLMKPVCRTVPKIHVLHNPRKTYLVKVFRYCDKTRDFEFEKNIKMDPGQKSSYIFVVVYVNWTTNYPFGMVIEAIRTEDNFATGMRILKMLHKVPQIYQRETVERAEELLNRTEEHNMLTDERLDCSSGLAVFTIDPPGSKDLDDALSIEELDGNLFRVGVHIADVTNVVKKDDAIDMEAQERATTFYPGQGINPYHMLPEPISTNMCSLIAGEQRAAISLFFTLNENAEVQRFFTRKTIIKSRHQYTYEEVQDIIDGKSREDLHVDKIIKLHALAKLMRKRRLGTAMNSLPVETALGETSTSLSKTIEAHYLVEEFMVLSNYTVGRVLIKTFPSSVPLRCQNPPQEEKVLQWLKDNKYVADLIIKLQGVQPQPDKTLSLQNIDTKSLRHWYIMPLQKCTWKEIYVAAKEKNLEKTGKLIRSDELHPGIALAFYDWIEFQESARYRCSGDIMSDKAENIPLEAKHFSLATFPYVHFTSPIRRYADVVVHRLFTASLEKSKCPYTQEEISNLCEHINEVSQRAKRYQNDCQTLCWGKKLQETPILLNSYVKETTDSGMSLVFPGMRKMPARYREIPFKLLQVSARPDMETDTQLTLHWSRRVYHKRGRHIYKKKNEEKPLERQKLDPYRRTHFVQIRQWKTLHDAVSSETEKRIQSAITEFPMKVNLTSIHYHEPGHVIDVTSEFPDGNILKQSCDFSMTFCRGQVLSIQVSAEEDKGIMVPSPQLLNLTRYSKFCLQHTRDPVKFLSKYSTTNTYATKYKSVADYLRLWNPLLEMEFASSAVRDDTATVNAVPVEFTLHNTGTFTLGTWYCDERDIDFTYLSRKILIGDLDDEQGQQNEKYCTDYLCIRCEIPNDMPPGTYMNSEAASYQGHVWMAHAQITKVTRIEEEIKSPPTEAQKELKPKDNVAEEKSDKPRIKKKWAIDFKLHPNCISPTAQMLDAEGEVRCCVEIIQKSEKDRRIEVILNFLNDATPLAKAIALRRRIPDMDDQHLREGENINLNAGIGSLQPSNESQIAAIRRSLTDRFSLIHGPPGTGKTYTAMKLVHLFRNINMKIHGEDKQIVFCGPSNKSVDLVARWMIRKFEGFAAHMVRLYGTSLENCDYPVPGRHFTKTSASKRSIPDPALSDVSVHNLIRWKNKPDSEEIKKYDKKFKRYMEILQAREERRKEKEACEERNMEEGREIPHDILQELITQFEMLYDIKYIGRKEKGGKAGEEIEEPEPENEVFKCLAIRHATMVYRAEDVSTIDIKSEEFHNYKKEKLKNFMDELFREQEDYKAGELLYHIKAFRRITADAVQRELSQHQVIFCTTAVATSARFLKATKGRIYQLIIDECGMCTEPESLAAIIATRAEQVVLIGDHKQLRPIIICKHAEELGLELSLFERYEGRSTMLCYQYRMHPEICLFPSDTFYGGRLVTKESSSWKTDKFLSLWRDKNRPIVFCHVVGKEEHLTVSTEEGNEMSSSNVVEVEKVMEVFKHMVQKDKIKPKDINVMSQYNAQCFLLKRALEKEQFENFNVNTVVASQGGEWDYVIMSTVRSLPQYRIEKYPTLGWCKENLGFITDDHQVNVALTRARKGLVIIGNKNLLECDPVWRKLIQHYGRKGSFVDAEAGEHFPRSFGPP